MSDTHVNRLRCTVSAVASSGLGAFTISTASSGYRTFGASQDGQTFTVLVTEGTAWEVNTGCTYTHSGTSLARGTLADSSTGSAITFTTAAVITEVASAAFGNRAEALLQGMVPGGRLTLESGVPVSTTDQTAKTSVYYTPHVHNVINLWDGANWTPTTFTEKTLALGTITSAKPYDVFGYLSSGQLVLELLAWTNDTTRATAVTLQDGRYCKSGDKTRLLLGSFYTTSTTTTEDSGGGTSSSVGGKRYLANLYNKVSKTIGVIDTTSSWTQPGTTIRQVRAQTGNKVEALSCLDGSEIRLACHALAAFTGATGINNYHQGIGVDTTTAFSAGNFGVYGHNIGGSAVVASATTFVEMMTVGRHAYNWNESAAVSTATLTVFGDAGNIKTGVIGNVQV